MAVHDWRRVKAALAEALEVRPEDRPAHLDAALAGEPALRAAVEQLLAADRDAGDFLAGADPSEPDVTDDDVDLGRVVGRYTIESCLGRGGMGSVYLARRTDQEFEHRVAVKMIRRGMDSARLVRRFRHERQILASLDHPHIARLFDGGTTDDGLPYFVMEYVDGVPIDRYADEHRLTVAARLRLCLRVIEAVQHAHDHQVVHRDLKPGNVLVTADGQPKLLDFGIAKILDAGDGGESTLMALRPMTPDYASPEQVKGEPVTPATDVHALGILLYELLTGRRPYRPSSPAAGDVARAITDRDADRPSIVVTRADTLTRPDGSTVVLTPDTVGGTRGAAPAQLRRALAHGLDDIVLKALRKDPRDRYPSAAALGDDVRRYLDAGPVHARRGAWRYRLRRTARRHRTALAATVLALAVAAATAAAVGRFAPAEPVIAAIEPLISATPVSAARLSAAVLRIRHLPARPEDAWLSTALAEMLTTELGEGGGLRVVPSDVVARAERDAAAAGAEASVADRIRRAVGVDYLVTGSVTVGTPAPEPQLRLDLQVLGPNEPIVVAGTGTTSDLLGLVADAGRELRRRLGLEEYSPEVGRGIRAALPQSADGTRWYAEGIARLRALDAVGALERLERAAAAEPGNPMIHGALAATWTALGYDARAEQEATRAVETSAGLNREHVLIVEGQRHEARKNWPAALDTYRTLWGFFADNAEYGLRLAAAQTAAGKAADALETVAALRGLPPPQSLDPRVDLAEAAAASALGDFPHELKAAQQAVEGARRLESTQLLARALIAEGRSYYNQGQPADAAKSLEEARRAFEAVGDRAGLAAALNSLGTVADDLGETERGRSLYEASLAAAEAVGDRRGMSSALNNLGILLKDAGRLTDARRMHERALALRREVGDRNWTAVSLSNIGVVLYEQDRLQEAARYYGEALSLSREIGDTRNIVRALHNLAIVQRELGQVQAARAGFEQSIPIRAEIRDRRGGITARVELGTTQLAAGDIAAARATETEAAAMGRALPLAEGEATATFLLGEVALAAGDLVEARRLHEQALALRRKIRQTRTELESEVALAAVALEQGALTEIRPRVQRVLTSSAEQEPVRWQALLVDARARLAANDAAGAQAALRDARAGIAASERLGPKLMLELTTARVEMATGRTAEARARLEDVRRQVAPLGLALVDLEARLLLAEATPDGAGRRAALQRLIADAGARGAGLIQRRARALLAS